MPTKSISNFPQLIIVPNPDSNSFDLMLKYSAKDVDVDYITRVNGIKWDMNGPKPVWLTEHKYVKMNKKQDDKIDGLPQSATKAQITLMGAKHFFKDREFTTRELIGIIGNRYYTYDPSYTGILLGKSKIFSRRKSGHVIFWKYIEPSEEKSLSLDVRRP